MRLASLLATLALSASTFTYADTILVGTDLSSATKGGAAVLCPSIADCLDRASQFTLLAPSVIHSVSVVVTGPGSGFTSDGNFTVGLGSVLGVGVTKGLGAGDLLFNPKGGIVTEEFTFSGLNLALAAGTYYLGMAGANLEWDYATPLSTHSTGTIGSQLSCDPGLTCGNPARWDTSSKTYAMQIDGTTVPASTPEPSTLALFGTGILGLAGVARRRFSHI